MNKIELNWNYHTWYFATIEEAEQFIKYWKL